MNARGGRLHVEPRRRNFRVADSEKIGRDHGKFLRQKRDDRLPHPRCLGVAVEKNDCRSVTGGQIGQFNALDDGRARSDGVFICPIQRGAQKKCEGEASKTETIFQPVACNYTKSQFLRRVVSKRNQARRSVSSVQTSIRLAVAMSRCSSQTSWASRRRAANVLLSSANSAIMSKGSTYSASLSRTR